MSRKTQPAKLGLWNLIRSDYDRWFGSFSFKKFILLVLFQPGFQLTISLRLQRVLIKLPLVGGIISRILWYISSVMTSSEVSRYAKFGRSLYIPHPQGIVVGEGVVVGDNVTVYQRVTLGVASFKNPAYPKIGDDCVLSSGCAVLGDITLGHGVTVGANAVVLKNIPGGKLAVGVPARII